MIRFPTLLALLALLLRSACSAQETELTLGKILSRQYDFVEAGKSMRYSLYVPTSYEP